MTVIHNLLAWYRTHKRRLPWRETNDPYRIFMSELMLQQTQVDRVIPKYQSWIKRFPSWKRLAAAKTSDLIRAWSGLGYNRRALYARESARHVLANGIPTTLDEWKKLKGVGPYMSAALFEFVNHGRAVVIDTNVRRVAGRVFLGLAYPSTKDDPRIIKSLGRRIKDVRRHWDVPQAFMDLASDVCRITSPQCAVCPLRADCMSSVRFLSGDVPKRRVTHKTERKHREKQYPDRIYRGRILAYVSTHESTPLSALGPHIDPSFDIIADSDWLSAMVKRLATDGLIRLSSRHTLSLPHS